MEKEVKKHDKEFWFGFGVFMVGFLVFLLIRLTEIFEINEAIFWGLNTLTIALCGIGFIQIVRSILNDEGFIRWLKN